MARGGRSRSFLHLTVAAVAVLALAVGCSATEDGSGTDPSVTTPSGPSGPGGSTAGTAPTGVLALRSTAFADGEAIPLRHACTAQGGENASPPLSWSGVPDGTDTLVLVVNDPDAPLPGGFTHLVTTIPTDLDRVDDGANLTGSGPMVRWIGPCPPSGEHRYVFTLYAFGADVTVPADGNRTVVEDLAGDALGVAELTGVFVHQD